MEIDDEMLEIKANIDDMNPELYSYVIGRLFDGGANDVYLTPIIMKKGRPALKLNVLVHRSKILVIRDIILSETTTLGLRYYPVTCVRLRRSIVKVETPWGKVDVKLGFQGEKMVNFAPENKDCEKIAAEWKIPLKDVYDYLTIKIKKE
ncbi:MAG: LarC family nickel insertion protein [Deltaproteobacteria bacterium]|nr:LarC family nickel insertion protein [Deltaproteobacteria bacterium]